MPRKPAGRAGLWGRLTTLQKWLSGIVIAALATALGGVLSGFFTAQFQAVLDRFTGGPVPITVTAALQDPGYVCAGGQGWVFPTGSHGLGPATAPKSDWAAAHGGVPASGNYAVLTIQGTSSNAVVLTGLRVKVVSRRPAVAGDYAHVPGQCGGFTPRLFVADLDRQPVRAVPVAGYDGATGNTIPAINFPFKVSSTDPEQLYVRVYMGDCDCDWTVEIDWVAAGRTGSSHVTDNGKPFRLTGLAAANGYLLNYTTHTWDAWACDGCLGGKPYGGPPELKPKS
jgi:hypothetical protein